MTAAPLWPELPDAYGYTAADLHALPDDGRRYELIDGSIIVSPSATIDHNTIAMWIATALKDSCPIETSLFGLDQSATIDDAHEPRPDVIVTLCDPPPVDAVPDQGRASRGRGRLAVVGPA